MSHTCRHISEAAQPKQRGRAGPSGERRGERCRPGALWPFCALRPRGAGCPRGAGWPQRRQLLRVRRLHPSRRADPGRLLCSSSPSARCAGICWRGEAHQSSYSRKRG
jgi:hypothetical protein